MNDTRHVEEAPPAAWFALRTSSRREKRVHERLLGIEIEAFLPLWERLRRWKDRLQRVQVPLAGVRGVLLQKDRKSRLVIGVDIIRQGASVEIDVADVVPA